MSLIFVSTFLKFASSKLHVNLHDQHQQLYISVLKNTSKEGLELLRLLINSGALLCKKCMLQDLGVPCITQMWDPSHYSPCMM